MTKKNPRAEIIRLPFGIPGVGRAGDRIISNPDEDRPEYRLLRLGFLDPDLLPAIRERVAAQSEDAEPGKEVSRELPVA